METDDIQYPTGFDLGDVVGWGITGLVVLDESSNTIIKTPLDKESVSFISREQQIYERFTELGGHMGIVCYHGTFDSGIRLEYASKHNLRALINEGTSQQQRLRWAVQIAEAVDFIHAAGVIHGDMTCANKFVDEGFDTKLADFAGSSLDGSPLLVAVTASHESPGPLLSAQADLFPLGCVFYELMTGQIPHDGKEDEEIEELYKSRVFPDTDSLGAIGHIITQCWQARYVDCRATVNDLKSLSA